MELPRSESRPIGASRKQGTIAVLTLAAIALHLLLRFGVHTAVEIRGLPLDILPLVLCLVFGGGLLVFGLLTKLFRREFGSDLLAGISIVTSVLLGEYLAGSLVVLMLSGGEALEAYAVRSASSVLEALARRMPSRAHRKQGGTLADVPLEEVAVGDELVVLPHEICPVDGTVLEGRGTMDESFLTGEPYLMSKAPGSAVLSGAINGDTALTIRAEKLAEDSRYARIMQVMRALGAAPPAPASARRSAWGRSTRRWPSPSPWPPGRRAASRSASWPCWWSRRPARCSSPSRWRSSARSRWRRGGASSSRTRPSSRRSTPAAPRSSTRPGR